MNNRRRCVTIFLSLLLASGTPLRADHPPPWLVSKRAILPSILGLSLGHSSLRAACAILGQPNAKHDLTNFPGEAEYVWKLERLTVTGTTMYASANRTRDTETLYAVEILGSGARRLTSDDIRIGSSFAAVVNAFGCKYLTDWRPPKRNEAKVITFIFQDDSELSAAFDDRGALVRLFARVATE